MTFIHCITILQKIGDALILYSTFKKISFYIKYEASFCKSLNPIDAFKNWNTYS